MTYFQGIKVLRNTRISSTKQLLHTIFLHLLDLIFYQLLDALLMIQIQKLRSNFYKHFKKACNRSRTGDLLLTRQVLYQLSYTGLPTSYHILGRKQTTNDYLLPLIDI